MRTSLITLLVAATLTAACKKHETVQTVTAATSTETTSSAASSTTSTSEAETTATTTPSHAEDDLLALASGAVVVQRPQMAEANGAAWYMFDEDPATGWTSADGKWNQPTVVELADRSVIKILQFDTGNDAYDGRIPKEIEVAVSDTSAKDGFTPIAIVTLSPELRDGQTFTTSAQVPGRWLRLTIKKMKDGGSGFGQIMDVRAFGERLAQSAAPNITGTYKTDAGLFHLKQEGTTVTGCYDHGVKPLSGGMEGRLLKFTYDVGESGSGPAIAIFGSDGYMFGGWWRTNGASEHPKMDPIEGHKTSDAVGKCPDWRSPQDQMASDIRKTGRVRLYGINFDSDSDHIRDESKPALDQVATMLKSNPDLKITVEGHTDSTSTPEHNQQLSEQRATAVKQYLVSAGIAGSRLNTAGFGDTRPVANNNLPLGRAANRRVELAKM